MKWSEKFEINFQKVQVWILTNSMKLSRSQCGFFSILKQIFNFFWNRALDCNFVSKSQSHIAIKSIYPSIHRSKQIIGTSSIVFCCPFAPRNVFEVHILLKSSAHDRHTSRSSLGGESFLVWSNGSDNAHQSKWKLRSHWSKYSSVGESAKMVQFV